MNEVTSQEVDLNSINDALEQALIKEAVIMVNVREKEQRTIFNRQYQTAGGLLFHLN